MEPHVDNAPYVEQTAPEVPSELNDDAKPPQVVWTCPICKGPQQTDVIEEAVIVRATPGKPLWLDIICHCGRTHGEHQGCGFGFQVKIPASVLEHLK